MCFTRYFAHCAEVEEARRRVWNVGGYNLTSSLTADVSVDEKLRTYSGEIREIANPLRQPISTALTYAIIGENPRMSSNASVDEPQQLSASAEQTAYKVTIQGP